VYFRIDPFLGRMKPGCVVLGVIKGGGRIDCERGAGTGESALQTIREALIWGGKLGGEKGSVGGKVKSPV